MALTANSVRITHEPRQWMGFPGQPVLQLMWRVLWRYQAVDVSGLHMLTALVYRASFTVGSDWAGAPGASEVHIRFGGSLCIVP